LNGIGDKNRKRRGFEMTGNLSQDWPVYVLLGTVVFFFIYMVIKSNQCKNEKKRGPTVK